MRAPREAKCNLGHMAVGVAIWDDLLAEPEVAYTRGEAPRDARTVPFPDELDPRVRAALESPEIVLGAAALL